jgi:hypothetical protein
VRALLSCLFLFGRAGGPQTQHRPLAYISASCANYYPSPSNTTYTEEFKLPDADDAAANGQTHPCLLVSSHQAGLQIPLVFVYSFFPSCCCFVRTDGAGQGRCR